MRVSLATPLGTAASFLLSERPEQMNPARRLVGTYSEMGDSVEERHQGHRADVRPRPRSSSAFSPANTRMQVKRARRGPGACRRLAAQRGT